MLDSWRATNLEVGNHEAVWFGVESPRLQVKGHWFKGVIRSEPLWVGQGVPDVASRLPDSSLCHPHQVTALISLEIGSSLCHQAVLTCQKVEEFQWLLVRTWYLRRKDLLIWNPSLFCPLVTLRTTLFPFPALLHLHANCSLTLPSSQRNAVYSRDKQPEAGFRAPLHPSPQHLSMG